MILFKRVTGLTATGVRSLDVLVDGSTVRISGDLAPESSTRVIDAAGLILGPGLVDMHVHLREPGEEHKEDVESGSRAAARGGYTALVAMPNTRPPCDSVEMVQRLATRGRAVGLVKIVPTSAVTLGRSGKELVDIEQLHRAGVRIFTDDGDPVSDPEIMRSALAATAQLGGLVAQHCEDAALDPAGHLHDGEIAWRLGINGLPSSGETDMIERDLTLARETGGRLHVQHLSTAEGVELIAGAKDEGVNVTTEVTPHHLEFTEESVGEGGADFKMYPPLRSRTDRKALREGLRSGVIDMVATDHAPHTDEEKSLGLESSPRGVIGLETSLPVTGAALDWDMPKLFERMSISPARRAGLGRHGIPIADGSPANLTLIDPKSRWVPQEFASRSRNSPFRGMSLTGRAVMTIYEGTITWELTE